MKKYDVIAIGELNVDIIFTGLTKMPVPGREIIVPDCSVALGSSTAICASGLSALGLKTGFASKVGDDLFGHFVMEALKKNNIDTSDVSIDNSIKTGVTLSLSMKEDRAMVTCLGSIAELSVEDIDPSILNNTRHIHVGSFFLQHKLRPGLKNLFSLAREKGVTTSLDAGWDDSENWDYGIMDVLEFTDIFFPNEVEAVRITRTRSAREAADRLSEFAKMVVVKCGPKGAVGKYGDQILEVPTFTSLKPIDTTGAGDSFNAGFIYGFLNGFDFKSCIIYGNACGSISVTRIGGASACPGLEEVRRLIEREA